MSKRSYSLRLTNSLMLGNLRQDCSGVNGSYFMSSRYFAIARAGLLVTPVLGSGSGLILDRSVLVRTSFASRVRSI